MFSRQRKARVLFGLSDIILVTLAFETAYRTRAVLPLHFLFYLTLERKALLLGVTLLAWVLLGIWLEVYDRLDSAHPVVILRDTARQCVYGALGLVVFEYSMRFDLSRFFVHLFCQPGVGAAAAVPAHGGPRGGGDPARIRRSALCDGGGHRRTGAGAWAATWKHPATMASSCAGS